MLRPANAPLTVRAYGAERYVIACKSPGGSSKIFQIAFAKSDSSLFVTFPYLRDEPGRVGLVHLPVGKTYPTDLTVGHDFPVTSHAVKYSHHPSGRAHFSLSGKVRASIGKDAVPLSGAEGHIFTIQAQGMHRFDPLLASDVGNRKRGVIPFGFAQDLPAATKFTAFLYSEAECRRRFVQAGNESPWFLAKVPDGTSRLGILLATPFSHEGQRHFLMLTVEERSAFCAEQEVWLSLMGGFDPPDRATDHDQPTSFLMCIYPASDTFEALVRQVGTIDYPPRPT